MKKKSRRGLKANPRGEREEVGSVLQWRKKRRRESGGDTGDRAVEGNNNWLY